MPNVPAGFEARVVNSSNTSVVKLDGTIIPPNDYEPITLEFEIKKLSDGTIAKTKPLNIIVPSSQFSYLSNMQWESAKSGYGSVVPNNSVSGNGIKLAGIEYKKGLGTHAESEVIYKIDKKYSSFSSVVGVDDSQTDNGSVQFHIYGDGKLIYGTGILRGSKDNSGRIEKINVNVKGVTELKLVVTDGGDGINSDHADWADTTLTFESQESTQNVSLMNLKWSKATTAWGTIQINKSIYKNPIRVDGKTYKNGIGTHANSEIVYDLNNQYKSFQCLAGIDDETGKLGSVVFKVYGDDKLLFNSGITKNTDKAKKLVLI